MCLMVSHFKLVCNRCFRPMKGSTAYDGACECGGFIKRLYHREEIMIKNRTIVLINWEHRNPSKYLWVCLSMPWFFGFERFYKGGCLGLGLLFIEWGL